MENKLELHAVVELFGHQKMAGKVTEQSIGPSTFVRIDVPETNHQPAFTRLLNPSAIYAIVTWLCAVGDLETELSIYHRSSIVVVTLN